jgi:hypothetical protein
MGLKIHNGWLLAILAGLMSGGCDSARARRPYPEDPLLLYKRPIEGRPDFAVPRAVARSEPAPPVAPAAVADAAPAAPSSGPEFRTAERSAGPVPAHPTAGAHRAPVAPIPTTRTLPAAHTAAAPTIRRQVPETFGRAPDYTWLQGTLEKHHAGHWELRYCDVSVTDKWGGKVTLMDEPRLNHFKEGDLILIEGEIEADQGARSPWRHFPLYRVREVWLAQPRAGK